MEKNFYPGFLRATTPMREKATEPEFTPAD
jgi:hypothetical protein